MDQLDNITFKGSIYPKELKVGSQRDTCIFMKIILFKKKPKGRYKCPPRNEWTSKHIMEFSLKIFCPQCCGSYMRLTRLHSQPRRRILTRYHMDEIGGHYAKRNDSHKINTV
jgi:hypothetical protein